MKSRYVISFVQFLLYFKIFSSRQERIRKSQNFLVLIDNLIDTKTLCYILAEVGCPCCSNYVRKHVHLKNANLLVRCWLSSSGLGMKY